MPVKGNLSIKQHNIADATITLDGMDISNLTRGYAIEHKVGDIPSVKLDVLVTEVDFPEQPVYLRVPDETRDLLVRWGWTPPDEQNESRS